MKYVCFSVQLCGCKHPFIDEDRAKPGATAATLRNKAISRVVLYNFVPKQK
jgi:hypothetical protein